MDSNPSTSSSSGNGGRFGTDGGTAGGSDVPPSAAFADAANRLGELKEYAGYWVAAKLDSYKSAAVKAGIYAALGVVGLVVGCTMLSTAVMLLLGGIAWGLGALSAHLFGDGWYWLGPFLVGLVLLGGAVVGAIFGLKWITRTTHAQLVAKYEDRKRQQRNDFGFDVKQRAREQRAAEREREARRD